MILVWRPMPLLIQQKKCQVHDPSFTGHQVSKETAISLKTMLIFEFLKGKETKIYIELTKFLNLRLKDFWFPDISDFTNVGKRSMTDG